MTASSSTAPAAAEPAAPIARTAVMALSLAAFASGISLRINDALLPRLSSDFGISIAQAASVITIFSVAYGLAQLLFGPLGDRFGKYLVIGWGCAACALTASLCGLSQTFPQLVGARLLAGATAASVIPLSMAWIGDVVPYERRQPVLARFLIGQIMGLSVGVWLGGFAADHWGWRLPFLVIGAIFAVISALLFSIHRRLPAHARQRRTVLGHPVRTMLNEFGQILARPWARVVLMTVFAEGACLYGAFAFIATHLHTVFAVSLSTAGAVVMGFGMGGLLFALFSAALVRRLGEVGLSLWGGVLITGSLLAVGLAPSWWWAIPACFTAGLGFYMFHNTLQINATQMAPERRGAAVSAFASCFFLGQAAGVAAAGVLTAHAGTRWVLVTGALGVLALALNFSRLRAEVSRRAAVVVA